MDIRFSLSPQETNNTSKMVPSLCFINFIAPRRSAKSERLWRKHGIIVLLWRKHGHLPRLRELENQPLESRRLIRAGSSFCGRGTAGVWGASRLKWLLGGANSNYATCEQMDCALPTTWIDLLAHGETLRSYI
ncbi:unnamed protein product, partial [Brenthis ino]